MLSLLPPAAISVLLPYTTLFRSPWQTGHMASLAPFLPSDRPTDSEDAIIDGFFAAQEAAGRILYPHQEEALLAVAAGDHVIAAKIGRASCRERASVYMDAVS